MVVGAGFGGLGCALALCELGLKPHVIEALKYPGGCASTFTRGGVRFESGATLFSGLGDAQLFGRWIDRYALPVTREFLDPVVELRTPADTVRVTRDREAFVEQMARRAGSASKAERVRAFFAFQKRVADALWSVLDAPELLPPFGVSSLLRHARGAGAYLPLLRILGRPLIDVLRRFGVADVAALRVWATALCQITVQCPPEEAEAAVALSALDYAWRGTGHVHGGIGELAVALSRAVTAQGGGVYFTERALQIDRREDGTFLIRTSRGERRARVIVLNVLPQDARALLGRWVEETRTLARLEREVRGGWGAAMLYLVARAPPQLSDSARHLELVADPKAPFIEGNHVFASIGSADEPRGAVAEGFRTITVSTHVRAGALEGASHESQSGYVASVQSRMRATLGALAPEWMIDVERSLPASPRTFQRFTRRSGGFVGGVPRRAGLSHYLRLAPVEVARGAWLVGDSVFPGQSILATAVGGTQVARMIARRLQR